MRAAVVRRASETQRRIRKQRWTGRRVFISSHTYTIRELVKPGPQKRYLTRFQAMATQCWNALTHKDREEYTALAREWNAA